MSGRVVLAMSGGVDSSVCAHLLVQQGYEVIGLFMRTGTHEPPAGEACETTSSKKIRGCCSALDAGDAQRVADRLNLPFYALNFQEDFRRIKDYFADEYFSGRTPNPCVVCNTWLKFGRLWEYAEAVGADYIATGHYAQTKTDPVTGQTQLLRAIDPTKDQSYFLFGLRSDILPKVKFPIGGMHKPQVREIAEKHNLGVHKKPDSQEICFVPSGNYADFLQSHRPDQVEAEGRIVDHTGKELGTHQGISRYTIGQRKGLGIAVGEPRYVLQLQAEQNLVVIGPRELLEQESLEAERVNWLLPQPPTGPIECDVKIRYLHHPTKATVTPMEDDRVHVAFDVPQAAVTPGQATVFYQGDRVLGGGWIC